MGTCFPVFTLATRNVETAVLEMFSVPGVQNLNHVGLPTGGKSLDLFVTWYFSIVAFRALTAVGVGNSRPVVYRRWIDRWIRLALTYWFHRSSPGRGQPSQGGGGGGDPTLVCMKTARTVKR